MEFVYSRSAFPGQGRRGTGAPVDQVELRVVAADHPRRGMAARGARQPAPGVATRLIRGGGGVDAPQLFSGADVVGGDETAPRTRARRIAPRPGNQLALHDDRSSRLRDALAIVGPFGFPDHLSGACVQRDEKRVVRGQEDLVVVDRDVAIAIPRAGDVRDVLREVAAVLPQQVAGRRIERLDDVLDVGEKHDPVVDDRLDFLIAVLHRSGPDQPQFVDGVRVNLGERAVAPQAVAVAEADPVLGRRLPQHDVGDRHEAVQQLGHGGRRRGLLGDGAEGEHDEARADDKRGRRSAVSHRNLASTLARCRRHAGPRSRPGSPPACA